MNQNLLISLRNLRAITLTDERNPASTTRTFSKETRSLIVDPPAEISEKSLDFDLRKYNLRLKSTSSGEKIIINLK
jgi:hypothetical protein